MRIRSVVFFIAIALACYGCASKPPVSQQTPNAFLDAYVLSKEGLEEHELVSFWKKGVAWQRYKKVFVEPVVVNVDVASGLNRVPHAEKAKLCEMLEFRLRESVKPMFKLAKAADPDTLRMQFIVTDTATANALLASLQSMHPTVNLSKGLNQLLTGTETFRGTASIIGKITDSTTGDLLMAVTDQTMDKKVLEEFMIVWGNVDKHYKYWTRQLGYQLCQHQGHNYCQKP